MKPAADTHGGGFAALASLLVLVALVTTLPLLAAAGRLFEAQRARRAAAVSRRAAAYEAVRAAASRMREDPTPRASSYHDPLYRRTPTGTIVTPVEPPLGRDEANDEQWLYPFFNVNTAPADRLERVAADRLPEDVSPARALSVVRATRERGELLTPDTLRRALGSSYDALHPVITAQPLLNANTASERSLERVLRRHVRSARAAALASRLVAERGAREIHAGELPELLGVPADAPVLAEIGVRGHLVQLGIRRGGRRYEALLVRLPGPDPHTEIRVLRFAEVPQ